MRVKQEVKSRLSSGSRLKRKNFLPTLVLAILFWVAWSWFVFSYPPANNFLLFTFYFLLFLATFLTAALIFANSRRGFFLAAFLILFLLFRYYQIANLLNLFLLAGIFISLEVYFSSKN
ncbi:MAG: hypothetical protein ACPLXP_00780 [Microgenomates group bacterium]